LTCFRPENEGGSVDVDIAMLEALADTSEFRNMEDVLEYAYVVVNKSMPHRKWIEEEATKLTMEGIVPLWARKFAKSERCQELCERHGIAHTIDKKRVRVIKRV